jgi:hypothetical protein
VGITVTGLTAHSLHSRIPEAPKDTLFAVFSLCVLLAFVTGSSLTGTVVVALAVHPTVNSSPAQLAFAKEGRAAGPVDARLETSLGAARLPVSRKPLLAYRTETRKLVSKHYIYYKVLNYSSFKFC